MISKFDNYKFELNGTLKISGEIKNNRKLLLYTYGFRNYINIF